MQTILYLSNSLSWDAVPLNAQSLHRAPWLLEGDLGPRQHPCNRVSDHTKLPWYLQYVDGKPLSAAGFSPATGQWKRMLKACYFSLLAKGMCITRAAEFIPRTRPPCSGPFCRGSSSLSVLGTWRRRAAWVSTPWGCLLFAKLQGAWLQNLCQLLKQTALRVPLDILDGLEEGITTGSQGTFHRFSQINSKS